MTSVNMPRDDAAIRIDPKTVAKRDVKQAEAYPETPPVKEHEEGHMAVPPTRPRQQKRRQGDRRQKDVPVLLDTRSGGDRRRQDKEDDEGPAEHIDVRV